MTMDRSQRMIDILAALLLASLFALLLMARIARQPELIYNVDWVLGESGNQLFRADCVRAGMVIYRDFASQYGPLPTYFCGLIALIFGNSIYTNQITHLFIRAFALLSLYAILRRRFGPARSITLVIVAGVPSLLPFASTGTFTHVEYISIEVAILSWIMALYRPPETRGLLGNLLIGLLLGLCQWVKFGGGVIAGVAVLAVDVIWLIRVGPERARVRRCFGGMATILIAATVMELLFAGLVLLLCPLEVARDAIWPSYMIGDYAGYTNRWPAFTDWTNFISRQLLPLSCLALGVVALVRDSRKRFEGVSGEGLGAYVGLMFFVIGVFTYMRHEFLIYQYCWTVIPAGCLALGLVPRPVRAFALLAWAPAFALVLKMNLLPSHPASLTPFLLPTREIIYPNKVELARVETILAVTDAIGRGRGDRRIFYANGWNGGGYYHYISPPPPIRNLFLVPHGFRPHDERELASKLDRISAFIWSKPVGPDKSLRGVLTAGTVAKIMADFEVADAISGSPGLVTVLVRGDEAPTLVRPVPSRHTQPVGEARER